MLKKFDIDDINLNDLDVWDMICEGDVKGCFQIESKLGRTWCKEMRPRSIVELSDVVAAIRPGSLKSKLDGKSMTKHYADRKNGKEEIPSLYPSIDSLLSKTYGVILYQEQSMKIAEIMAGFDPKEADNLRKAIGKKDAKLMKEMRVKFMEGCDKNGVPKEKAEEVFDIIEKSNRYSFNKSHSVSYAIQAYQSAYEKHHYTLKFFKNWLIDSGDKMDPKLEVKQLIMSAKSKGIEVKGPTIKYLEENFHVKGRTIYFGICSVKNVGSAHLKSLIEHKADKVDSWSEMLFFVLPNVNSRAVSCLIQTGAFSHLGKTRTEMLHEFTCMQDINEKETEWIKTNYHPNMSIVGHLKLLARTKKEGGGCHTANRVIKVLEVIKKIETPGRLMSDNPFTYSKKEEELLGVSVSQSELSCNASAAYANSTCKEINDGRMEKVSIAGILSEIKVIKTRKGDPMCFITIEDETGELEGVVVFPKLYEQHQSILYLGSTILVSIETQVKDGSKSFIAQGIIEI